MSVREATLDDLPYIINLAGQMHAESRYRRTTFLPARLGHVAAGLIASPDGFAVVAEKDGEIIGTMLAQVMREPWFAAEPVAYEYGVYVTPEHRGNHAAARMVRMFDTWAQERGAVLIDLGISTGINDERTGAFYARLGFTLAGFLYSKEV